MTIKIKHNGTEIELNDNSTANSISQYSQPHLMKLLEQMAGEIKSINEHYWKQINEKTCENVFGHDGI